MLISLKNIFLVTWRVIFLKGLISGWGWVSEKGPALLIKINPLAESGHCAATHKEAYPPKELPHKTTGLPITSLMKVFSWSRHKLPLYSKAGLADLPNPNKSMAYTS